MNEAHLMHFLSPNCLNAKKKTFKWVWSRPTIRKWFATTLFFNT